MIMKSHLHYDAALFLHVLRPKVEYQGQFHQKNRKSFFSDNLRNFDPIDLKLKLKCADFNSASSGIQNDVRNVIPVVIETSHM